MATGITKVRDDWEKVRADMLNKLNQPQAVLERKIYPMYQQLQLKRWQSQGSSEGETWDALSPAYKARKLKKFRSDPGEGRFMLVATGNLFGATVGNNPLTGSVGNQYHRKLISSTGMEISVEESGDFNYPHFVNDLRPFMEFSDPSIEAMKEVLMEELFSGLI